MFLRIVIIKSSLIPMYGQSLLTAFSPEYAAHIPFLNMYHIIIFFTCLVILDYILDTVNDLS